MSRPPPVSILFPYTTLFRSAAELFRSSEQLCDVDTRSARHDDTSLQSCPAPITRLPWRSEEHTSELQSHRDIVCRLLLEKKNIRPRHVCHHRAALGRGRPAR